MSNSLKLNKEFALELTCMHDGQNFDTGFDTIEVLKNEQVDSSRWSSIHALVIKIGLSFWEITYERGLTENQDIRPFEYEPNDTVEFYRVTPVIRPIIDYVKVEDDSN